MSGAPKLRQELAVSSGSFGFRFGARDTACSWQPHDHTPVGPWLATRFSLESQGLQRSNTSQLSARRQKFRANAWPARGFRTSSQLLRLQVLRVGRAAKLAALKLRVSRAGRALLGLAPGSSGKPKEAPGSFGSWETRAGGPAEVFLEALSALGLARGARVASAQTHRS